MAYTNVREIRPSSGTTCYGHASRRHDRRGSRLVRTETRTVDYMLEEQPVEIRNHVARSAIHGLVAARKTIKIVAKKPSSPAPALSIPSSKLGFLRLLQTQNLLHIVLSSAYGIAPSGLWVAHDGDLHRLGTLEDSLDATSDPESYVQLTITVDTAYI